MSGHSKPHSSPPADAGEKQQHEGCLHADVRFLLQFCEELASLHVGEVPGFFALDARGRGVFGRNVERYNPLPLCLFQDGADKTVVVQGRFVGKSRFAFRTANTLSSGRLSALQMAVPFGGLICPQRAAAPTVAADMPAAFATDARLSLRFFRMPPSLSETT